MINEPNVDILPLKNCVLFRPSICREARGEIFTLHNDEHHKQNFVEDKLSRSYRNVLRGMHGDYVTTKLVSCLRGEVFFVLYDGRANSDSYKQTYALILSERDRLQVLVPPGVFNGHYCLSDECLFWYKMSHRYSGPASQLAIKWDSIGIDWPCAAPLLSRRDEAAQLANEFIYSVPQRRHYHMAISGYFNPLHQGHLDMIEAAASMCDILTVIVNNDDQVKLKGSKAFMDQNTRLRIVKSISSVSNAILSIDTGMSVSRTLDKLWPNAFGNGGDVGNEQAVREIDVCKRLNIELVFNLGGGKIESSSRLLGARNE